MFDALRLNSSAIDDNFDNFRPKFIERNGMTHMRYCGLL